MSPRSAPEATRSSSIPGKYSSRMRYPLASKTFACSPCGTPLRFPGNVGESVALDQGYAFEVLAQRARSPEPRHARAENDRMLSLSHMPPDLEIYQASPARH